VKPLILLLTAFGSLTLAQPQAFAESRWTFCAASAQGTRDVWITDVFAAPVARGQLESELKSVLERQIHTRVDDQARGDSASQLDQFRDDWPIMTTVRS
jgi:hypothetical protein